MSLAFNYRHLYYFWVVAKEGGMSRAATRLDMAIQTVSAQVRELERDLGCQLLKPAGRGLALTEAGVVALQQAEQIFQLGESLPELVRGAAQVQAVRLTVGIADGLPKLVVQRLLQPVLATPGLRLVCHEGEMADLLADLALHRMDVVLSDHPAPFNPHLKVHNHPLGASAMGWYAAPYWWEQAQDGFPASLNRVPVLLPTTHSTVRRPLDQWLIQHRLRPRVVGEFEDSALLETFGGSGLGVFPAALSVQDDLLQRHQARLLGPCEGVEDHYYAISTERRVKHPVVQQLLARG
ncbi:MAG: LysR family transcriptional regulator [Alicycliphilus sp.]|jgi:LysR family transcriptional activator of nhaA|uniref:LysR family transcriptional regulator n=1 Tax=Diaphorobacter limosus TaxID=3036128 RepID=A0ABZ0IYI4_9BURK|nr:LysR family transcriptional regulator [Diaphorobacter sp. Y-1]MBP6753720.1 LysR family transcriptional regulator [Alicycliphilus sp.]MBP7327301.1 LysR family transcriptional regulator [Alicycliphilus sp.]WOO31045.1 LysR family transcriptional regulator [Diaphorobacter sp. Y-1]HRM49165.1 LysR family transcriptional regulator [Alicycliphilus sp.]HRN63282.1 LysR family transcriptional regulator [Alicycliphilus sp.]